MSALSDVATVQLLIADYAAADPAGKLNIIGGGITMVGRLPEAPATSPFFVVVSLGVPPDHYGEESVIEIRLDDSAGNVVVLPGATPDLPSTPLMIRHIARFSEPAPPQHLRVPERYMRGYLRGRVQIVVGFPGGLPLPVSESYVWRVRVDGEARDDWAQEFVVAEQIPAASLIEGGAADAS